MKRTTILLCIAILSGFLLFPGHSAIASLVEYRFNTITGPGSMPAEPFDVQVYGFTTASVSGAFIIDTAAADSYPGQGFDNFPNPVVSWTINSNDGIIRLAGTGGSIIVDTTGGRDYVCISGKSPTGTTGFGPYSINEVTMTLRTVQGGALGGYFGSGSIPDALPPLEVFDMDASVSLMMYDNDIYRTSTYVISELKASSVPIPSAIFLFAPGLAGVMAIQRRQRSGF